MYFRYHSAQDTRLPDTFVCFDCRLRRDPSWELIKVGLYPTMLSKFRDLASFRYLIVIRSQRFRSSVWQACYQDSREI